MPGGSSRGAERHRPATWQSESETTEAQRIIDLDRYPIENLETPAARGWIAACRRALDERALCLPRGFLRPRALARMVAEAEALAPGACRSDNLRTAYGWTCNDGFAPDHPRSALHRHRSSTILTDRFPADGTIARLFQWDPLTDFVRAALGFETL